MVLYFIFKKAGDWMYQVIDELTDGKTGEKNLMADSLGFNLKEKEFLKNSVLSLVLQVSLCLV